MNKVLLLGNIGKDPELRMSAGGSGILKFSLATNERYNDQEHTEWHNIVMFGKRAEALSKHLNKGDKVLVEGRIRTNKYEDREGVTRYSTSVVIDHLEFANTRTKSQGRPPAESDPDYGKDDIAEDDIPF